MNIEELNKILSVREAERIEFKEAKEQISILGKDEKNGRIIFKSLYAYCVAIGNEGGGRGQKIRNMILEKQLEHLTF